MIKRIKVVSIVLCLVLSTVLGTIGCTTTNGKGGANSEYANRKKKITMSYYLGGYGEDHMNAIAKDFMDNYDDEIYLEMKPYVDSANMRSLIQAGEDQGDIIQLSVDMFRNSAYLEELSELVNMTALDEDKVIKDKDPENYAYYLEDYYVDGEKKTGVFQLPSGPRSAYAFAVNETTLKEAFGDEAYTLPRTTDEFFAFGNTLLDKGVFLTSAAISDATGGGDYMTYLYQLWFAQLTGLEAYDKFCMGEVYNASTGQWALAEGNDMSILSNNKDEIIDAYTVCNTLLSADNMYIHSSSRELDYLKNDIVFGGGGCGSNRAKTAFLFIGSWFEKEIEPLIEDGLVDPDQTYGVMRTPVASSLVKYLEYRNGGAYMSDSMLADVIRAIDEGKTSYAGVSEKDFARIKEARKMAVSQISSDIVVPKIKDESKREDIYKVLRYICSDRAQKVAAEAVGGVYMLPFGSTTQELDVKPTNFIQEYNKFNYESGNLIVDYSHINTLASQHLLHRWVYIPGGERVTVYIYSTENPQTPEKMYDSLYKNLSTNWPNYVKNYKTALGEK